MKKVILLISILGVILIGEKSALAQTFDYNRAYSDYIYNMQLYQNVHSEYDIARSQYLASGTLDAKEKARVATYKMLTQRDETVKTYLTAIRLKIKETQGIITAEAEGLYKKIDTEVGWFASHKTRIPSAATIEDLIEDSDEAKEHYEEITELVIYQAFIGIDAGKIFNIRSLINTQIVAIKTKVSEIRSNGDKDVSGIERAIVDVENKISRSGGKEAEARTLINSLKGTDDDKMDTYIDAEALLSDALLYLKDANSNLLDVIRQIKTQ